MTKHRKTWSKAEKLTALELAEAEGFAVASRLLVDCYSANSILIFIDGATYLDNFTCNTRN